MNEILAGLDSPKQLLHLDDKGLVQLAEEIRNTLCNLLSQR